MSHAILNSSFVTAAAATVTVDPFQALGPVKPMNAVNNGPVASRSDQSRGNFADFRALRVPYARTHDSIRQATSNGHTVDISAVFPDFEADENDPASYDFAYTDAFLETIIAAGTKPFFRLGQTIENGIKKYHVFPPTDFAKWARVSEHVILHCNAGWCGGHSWGIEYWEIWNEPDAQPDEQREKSCQWQGTKAEFFEFYETVAKHLKGRFPNLKIGGPALGFRMDWANEFIKWQGERGTPIDFFSWHAYSGGIARLKSQSREVRRLLDENGYSGTESILDEWNYIKNWTNDFPYSVREIVSNLGGAFTAAYLCVAQDSPIDLLMYYDARSETVFNGLFDFRTFSPLPAYYALFSWADLRDLGTQVPASVESPALEDGTVVAAIAAKGADGSLGILVSRYCDDRNVTASELGIEKHAYLYGCDEQGERVFTNIAKTVEILHREFPGVPVMTTARDRLLGTGESPLRDLDIHCPATCFWNGRPVKQAQAEGRKVWWYFCNNPADPFANSTLEGPPCELRSLMGAQTQKFMPDGFLYYATMKWNSRGPIVKGPFTDWNPCSTGSYHGDGQWTCCGGPEMLPLATLRLENFRDGLEDLWYAKLLEKKLREMQNAECTMHNDAEWAQRARAALAVPDEVARLVSDFSTDPEVIYRWRDEMADLIEDAGHERP